MELHYTIYCHIHVGSERRYVGLTKLTMMKRWNQHIYNSRKKTGVGCAHFWAAIRKYGPEAFEHLVLETCETLEEANAAEIRWIEHYNTRDPEFGFNLADGGQHRPHPIRRNPWDNPVYRAKQAAIPKQWKSPEAIAKHKQVVSSDAYRKKRAVISREVHSRPSVKAKLSAAARAKSKPGPKFTFKGKQHSAETIEKLRAANIGNQHGLGRKRSDATRLKLDKIWLGRKHTEAARKKMSDANPKRYKIVDGAITSKLCRVHGWLEPGQFYVSTRKSGRLNVVCKECSLEAAQRSRDRARTERGDGAA